MTEPLIVIGIGLDGPAGLGPTARIHLAEAQVLAGSKRHLAFFPDFQGTKIILEGDLPGWIEVLKARDRLRKTVVLATGDPLFYGIGRMLLESFPKQELEFVPHVSSVALAFARLKETWNDACVVSVHGRPLQTLLPALHRREPKIAIFTDARNDPASIARLLCDLGLAGSYAMWIFEHLGAPDERITRWFPADPLTADFAPLNIVLLLPAENPTRNPHQGIPLFGIPESFFRRFGNMITKPEVRLQALSYLALQPGDVLWDVGAGSGSVSIEAGRLSPYLTVYAIEKSQDSLQQLRANLGQFGLGNVHLVASEAPACLGGLPDPDAVFIGGSGGRLVDLLDCAMQRLNSGGRLVVSCIALETLTRAWSWFKEQGLEAHATSIQVAHSRPLGNLRCMEPDNPITLLHLRKP